MALIVGVLAALGVPAAALAGYPPGPYPGPGPAGAFGVVVVSQTVCGADTIVADSGGSTVSVDVPAGAFGGCTQVTVYGMSGDSLALLLPSGETLLQAYAIGWDEAAAARSQPRSGGSGIQLVSQHLTAAAGAPLRFTIVDPAIEADSSAYLTTGSGLAPATDAIVQAGSASVETSLPAGFVLAAQSGSGQTGATEPPTSTPPGSGDANPVWLLPVLILAVLIAIGLMAVVVVVRRRTRTID